MLPVPIAQLFTTCQLLLHALCVPSSADPTDYESAISTADGKLTALLSLVKSIYTGTAWEGVRRGGGDLANRQEYIEHGMMAYKDTQQHIIIHNFAKNFAWGKICQVILHPLVSWSDLLLLRDLIKQRWSRTDRHKLSTWSHSVHIVSMAGAGCTL
jgi:hypothetical protein